MRREDKIGFFTTFTLFSLSILLFATFTDTLMPPPSSTEKTRFSVKITAMYQEKTPTPPKKNIKKKVEKKQIIVKNSPKKVFVPEKIEKIKEKVIPKVQQKQSHAKKVKEQILDQRVVQKQINFFRELKEEINSNKSYPRIAQRRNLEGDVKICFTIFENGSIKINELTGSKMFTRSSEQALLDTFPIDIPKELELSFPLKLNIELKYQLS